ncbi:MAG: hypothetical protein O2912_07235, partial [Proteobacteria bacterium]|nr:hypothetical protein [Pseudomonadota bacterium]
MTTDVESVSFLDAGICDSNQFEMLAYEQERTCEDVTNAQLVPIGFKRRRIMAVDLFALRKWCYVSNPNAPSSFEMDQVVSRLRYQPKKIVASTAATSCTATKTATFPGLMPAKVFVKPRAIV